MVITATAQLTSSTEIWLREKKVVKVYSVFVIPMIRMEHSKELNLAKAIQMVYNLHN